MKYKCTPRIACRGEEGKRVQVAAAASQDFFLARYVALSTDGETG